MPDPNLTPETDLHSSLTANPPALGGGGTYTEAVSPQSQVATQQRRDGSLRSAARQKVKSITPGQDVAGKPSIKGRTSFSDELGD